MSLSNLGNVSGYEHKVRVASRAGLVETPQLVLKLYTMEPHGAASRLAIAPAAGFLKSEINQGHIAPYLGMGFAILSEDMFNVARWDTKYPHVLKNQLYAYEGDISGARLLDIRDDGSFCAWELGIVAHEKDAWLRYLSSGHTEADKQAYLDSFISGMLDAK